MRETTLVTAWKRQSEENGHLGRNLGVVHQWQQKETNFNLPQWGQPYMAPPKAGAPQLIILSTFSTTD